MPALGSKIATVVRGYATYRSTKRARPVLVPAVRLARSDASDEDARQQLVPLVRRHPDAAQEVIERGRRSPDPVVDRASRLVRAARDGTLVPPVDPAKEAQLREFRSWSDVPLREAFARLEVIAPRLTALRAEAEAWHAAHPAADIEQRTFPWLRMTREVRRVLTQVPDQEQLVLRSDLAWRIALEYLEIALGDLRRGDASRSHAEIAATPNLVTFTIGRPPPGEQPRPPRPSA